MEYNLAALDEPTRDKINVDLAASAVAFFKEHYNMPVVAEQVEREQPTQLRDYISRPGSLLPAGFAQFLPPALRIRTAQIIFREARTALPVR